MLDLPASFARADCWRSDGATGDALRRIGLNPMVRLWDDLDPCIRHPLALTT